MIKKIISGGQTGADRAGLNVAIELGLKHGGWAPKGFTAEDGVVPKIYNLKEMPVRGYPPRTEQNVLDSDGTAIFYYDKPSGGTALTIKLCRKHKMPCVKINLSKNDNSNVDKLIEFFKTEKIRTLNVAGPRSSSAKKLKKSIGHDTRRVLKKAIEGQL